MKIEVNNCNNIVAAKIEIEKDIINIKYAMNGTGKSTIAKAIELIAKKSSLQSLKPFGDDSEPSGIIDESIAKILLFNEDFVNNIVFKESSVIQNAFEIFIKTPEYDRLQASIEEHLKNMRLNTTENQDLNKLLAVGQSVLSKFSFTNSGQIKKTGLMKNITNADNIFELPDEIKKFQPLMEKDYNDEWAGWKNDGAKYDDNGICPFCTHALDSNYQNEKEIFSVSYSKSNIKSIKEMLLFFQEAKDYINEEKYLQLYNSIKECNDEETIKLSVTRFCIDLGYLIGKINKVIEFDSYKVKKEEVSKLNECLNNLLIDDKPLEIFNSKKTLGIIHQINDRINKVKKETDDLKKEMGSLKGLINSQIENTVIDINDFLNMAAVNYRFEIIHESISDTKAILKYCCKSSDMVNVDNIRLHLSWGERNAFALILFMHYALSQDPDLIIFDDPISSFDSNKKYAIINRLFANNNHRKSLYKKTIMMLTHDFQPVIDFIVNNKPSGGTAKAWFLSNKNGTINESEVGKRDIKSFPILLAENAANGSLNVVNRITSLRKFIEHTKIGENHEVAYNLLSCLIHGKQVPTKTDDTPIGASDIVLGEEYIKKYMHDFSFDLYSKKHFEKNSILFLYKNETNNYYKLQVFRILVAVTGLRSLIDDVLLKYIDEQFHVENDYMFYLDLNKYDVIPDFIIPKCDEFLKKKKIL
jgi:ABC-type Mn2+/Zn2+ transport system ATPase subunit